MPSPQSSRQRGVRLSAEGIETLNAAIEDRWRRTGFERKLTRQARSEMLGVSLPTADKILSGEPVDRSSLTEAFKYVGIPWKSSYCVGPNADAVSTTPATSRPHIWRLPAVALLVVLTLSLGAFALWPKPNWTAEYDRELRIATQAFNEGKYRYAEQHLGRAMDIAESKMTSRDTEAALRLRGDLAAAQGKLSAAVEFYQATIRYRELRRKPRWPSVHEAIACIQTRTGDFEGATENLDIAEAGFASKKETNGLAEVMRDRGCLAAARGKHDQALEWFAKCLQLLTTLDAPDMAIDVRGERAMTLVHFGRLEEAHNELDECLRHWSNGRHKGWIALTEMRLGQLESKMGNRDSALLRLKHARESFKSLGNEARLHEAEVLMTHVLRP